MTEPIEPNTEQDDPPPAIPAPATEPAPIGAASETTPLTEEPWEAEIGDLLGQLPSVDPPAGFIDAAVDHRPLHAGRTLLGLMAATVALAGFLLVAGAVDRGGVVPPIDDLVARHDLAARAGLSGSGSGNEDGAADGVGAISAAAGRSGPLALPDGFEAEGAVTVEDVEQAVYARGDEAVSVFVQTGRVDWDALPDDRMTELGGLRAWVDGERQVAVIETDGSTLTIIGLSAGQLDQAIEGVVGGEASWGERASELAEAVVVQFGYAPVG